MWLRGAFGDIEAKHARNPCPGDCLPINHRAVESRWSFGDQDVTAQWSRGMMAEVASEAEGEARSDAFHRRTPRPVDRYRNPRQPRAPVCGAQEHVALQSRHLRRTALRDCAPSVARGNLILAATTTSPACSARFAHISSWRFRCSCSRRIDVAIGITAHSARPRRHTDASQ